MPPPLRAHLRGWRRYRAADHHGSRLVAGIGLRAQHGGRALLAVGWIHRPTLAVILRLHVAPLARRRMPQPAVSRCPALSADRNAGYRAAWNDAAGVWS